MRAVALVQSNPSFNLASSSGQREGRRPYDSSGDSFPAKYGSRGTNICCACRRQLSALDYPELLQVQGRQLERRRKLAGFSPLVADRRSLRDGGCKVRARIAEPTGEPAPMGQKTQYKDGLIDRLAMNLFRRKMQTVTGASTKETGYDAFVDVSKALMRGKSAEEQQAAVSRVLLSLIPRHLPYIIRTFFKPTRLSLELNALFTPSIFSWLVGPAEVTEVEVNGVKQRTGVKIKKCRYLEASGCVGMCVNVCKVPTQDFFTKEFGLPLTMNPNFDDMSCEMVFGQVPPPIEEDKAFQQPCFATLCSMAAEEKPKCPKLLTADAGTLVRE